MSTPALDRATIEARDPGGMLDDVLAMPLQLGDALWRAQSAGIRAADSPAGLVVCGMGGSAIGGDLAIAALGDRATRPISVVRGYALESWTPPETFVLCSSYSGRPRRRWPASRPPAPRARAARSHHRRHARGGRPGRGRPRGRRAVGHAAARRGGLRDGRDARVRSAVWGRTLPARGDRHRHGAAGAAGRRMGAGRVRQLPRQAHRTRAGRNRSRDPRFGLHRGGGPPLAHADQREREDVRLLVRAARGQPSRDLRLGAGSGTGAPVGRVPHDPDNHPPAWSGAST